MEMCEKHKHKFLHGKMMSFEKNVKFNGKNG